MGVRFQEESEEVILKIRIRSVCFSLPASGIISSLSKSYICDVVLDIREGLP